MKRDKNGRFLTNKKIEIIIPSIGTFLKYFIMMLIFLPWVYLSISKLDLISVIQKALTSLFGPIDCECDCECPSQKTPY